MAFYVLMCRQETTHSLTFFSSLAKISNKLTFM